MVDKQFELVSDKWIEVMSSPTPMEIVEVLEFVYWVDAPYVTHNEVITRLQSTPNSWINKKEGQILESVYDANNYTETHNNVEKMLQKYRDNEPS